VFGLGMWEILIILALALIFIGPKKLPDLARNLGRGLREFRNAANEIRVDFQRVDESGEKAEKTENTAGALPPATTETQESSIEPEDSKDSDDSEGGRA